MITRKHVFQFLVIFSVIIFSACSSSDDCNEQTWYADSDGDGDGNPAVSQLACIQPDGYVANPNDIDDSNANLNTQTVWQGETLTFSKASFADWTLEENQDRITDNVWITRQNNQPLFNIALNPSFVFSDWLSPEDTEWAIGSISDGIENLSFDIFAETYVDHDDELCPPCVLNEPMVLHLITDNIYIDFQNCPKVRILS